MQKPNIKLNLKFVNFKTILEITIKELKGFFDGLYGYLLLIIFLGVNYFLFFQSFFVIGNASARQFFDMLPLFLIVFIPAITMGTFARENDKQTIEYLLTKPVSSVELIIGKILSSFLFGATALLLTLPLPLLITRVGNVDLGETGTAYLAGLLLILALSSVGVMVSSFFKNQIAAFLVSVTVIFALYIVSSQAASANLPAQVSDALYQIGLTNYYTSMTRGILSLADILYFSLLTFVSAAITYVNLQKQRISNKKVLYQKAGMIIGSVALVTFMVMYLSQTYQYRLDLTQSRKYTLSNTTKEVLNKEGKVKLEVYASEDMPQEFKTAFDEMKNVLDDYQSSGKNNLEVVYINPKGKEAELSKLGIVPLQFSIMGNDQYTTKTGYLGIVVKSEDGSKTEVIPYVRSADDINNLEFQLTRLVNKVKQTTPIKLGFASGNGEYSQFEDYGLLSQVLTDNFTVESIYIPGVDTQDKEVSDAEKETQANAFNLDEVDVLMIANPTTKYTDESLNKIKDFVNKGGKVVYLADSNNIGINGQIAPAEEGKAPQRELFKDLGVSISADTIYDLKQFQTVGVTTSTGQQIPLPYPLFARLSQKEKGIENAPAVLQAVWANPLDITDDNWKVLYETTERGGKMSGTPNTDPAQNFSQENLGKQPVIAYRDFDNGGRIIISGNARMLTNDYVTADDSIAVFALSTIESLGPNAKLSEIRAKNLFTSRFAQLSDEEKNIIRIGAPLISLAVLGAIGGYRIFRRKKLKKYVDSLQTV